MSLSLRTTSFALVTLWAVSLHADEAAVYFGTGAARLNAKGAATIRRLAKREGARFQLSGSTDPRGGEEVNARLRSERVDAVKEALVAAGVSEGQIQVGDAESADEVGPKSYWKLRKVAIHVEGGVAVSSRTKSKPEDVAVEPTPKVEPKVAAVRPKPEPAPKIEPKVAALTTKPEPKTGPEPKVEDGKKSLEKINLIYWKALNHALWILAKQKGFFAEEGFDVHLKETDEDARVLAKRVMSEGSVGATPSGGVQTTGALESGQKKFFAGAICGFATHEAMARGEPIVDIGSMIMIPETLIMKKELADSVTKDIRSFKGKNIGDITYGEGEHDFKYANVVKTELGKVGLKEKKDYKFIEYNDFGKEYADLKIGKIDVAKGFPPGDVDFVRGNPEFIRVPLAKFFPYLPCCRQVVTRKGLKQNREKYVRLLRASIRAHEFSINSPREASAILARELKMPADVIRQAIMSAYVTMTPDPMRKGVELYQRSNDRYTGTKTATAEYVDTSLYQDALVSLAQEHKESEKKVKKYYETMLTRFKQNN